MPAAPPKPSTNGEVLHAALSLFDRGFWIVPCEGKKALWTDWPNSRRSRTDLIDALKGSHRNIALVLNRSDWIDIDCDNPEAESKLQELFGGEIPPTPTYRSARGFHRLFLRPVGLPKKAKLDLDGIEFRIGNDTGALSMLPPSVHPDGPRYAWLPGLSLDNLEPAELPPEIVERLCALERRPAAAPAADGDILEGKRNETLFQKACAIRPLNLPEETVVAMLLDLNARLCKPPLPETEVRTICRSALAAESKAKENFLTRLLAEVDLWHDENDEPFVTLKQGDHYENWRVDKRSRPFRRWLSKRFYDVTGEMIGAGDLADVASLMEGKAVFDGPRFKVFRRVAEHDGKFYLDLCDETWHAVEIDAEGWRVVSDPPVKFRRAKANQPLPIPVAMPATELKQLLSPFLNVRDEQWPLVPAWLVAALRAVGPYPILKLTGEQGSAKSTMARALRSLVDPNTAAVRCEPRDNRDLAIAANNGWVICLDNLSVVKPDLSDALCRLSTGGGFATRTLYTDDDETIFDAMRPAILTSIEEVGNRSDLLERSLIVELPNIAKGKRRTEKTFWKAFDTARPKILGAILSAVSGAIRKLPEIEAKPNAELSRMADFEQWGEAAEESLGLEPGTFAEAYSSNREAATQTALESSPVIAALIRRLQIEPYKIEATATDLLAKLDNVDPELKRQPGWPKTPKVLSQILKRVAPNLRQIGIVAVHGTRGGGDAKAKVWRIEGPEPARTKSAPTALGTKLRANHRGSQGSNGSQD